MEYVLSGQQMKHCDEIAIAKSFDKSISLIKEAANVCYEEIKLHNKIFNEIYIFCGPNKNGCDGLALAKILDENGYKVSVTMLMGNLCKEASFLLNELVLNRVDVIEWNKYNKKNLSNVLIVDAILGIGLSRYLDGEYKEAVEYINNQGSLKLSIDIPTGVCADNGRIMGIAVNADLTVTVTALKIGHLIFPGKNFCGRVIKKDIGIPLDMKERDNYCITGPFLEESLPKRRSDGNKGTFGKVLVVAGSKEISGAAYLSAMAAYRAGCGMVHIFTEETNRNILAVLIPEAIIHTYKFDSPEEQILAELKRHLNVCDVVCAGCGIGISELSAKIVKELIRTDKPIVIDADAINIIAKYKIKLGNSLENVVFTPHLKEMSRLTGLEINEIKNDALIIAKKFVEKGSPVLVLKDAVTLVSTKNRQVYINNTGNDGMAKAGSGDVLAGVISSFMAQGLAAFEAATLGVYVHGLAGDKKVKITGQYGLMARNLLEGIEEIVK